MFSGYLGPFPLPQIPCTMLIANIRFRRAEPMAEAFPIPPLYDARERPFRSCLNCRNFHRKGPGVSCSAYPFGIPYDIRSGETAHDMPIAGDNGVQWEAAFDAPTGLPIVEGNSRDRRRK